MGEHGLEVAGCSGVPHSRMNIAGPWETESQALVLAISAPCLLSRHPCPRWPSFRSLGRGHLLVLGPKPAPCPHPSQTALPLSLTAAARFPAQVHNSFPSGCPQQVHTHGTVTGI